MLAGKPPSDTAGKTMSKKTGDQSSRKPARPSAKKPTPKAKPAASTGAKPLTPKVQRFIDEYLIDMNPAAAYLRAGYKATGEAASVNARRLLRNAPVSLEIARKQKATAAKLEISREEALQEAWNIVKADANELIEYRRFACPACFGKEYDRADPRQDCDACGGEGHPNVMVKDTRNLSQQARSLYAGVKITKDGIEVKMHSKLDALEKVFKHLGLYAADKKLDVTTTALGPEPSREDAQAYYAWLTKQGANGPA